MKLEPLTAVSPLDGRYADKTQVLRPLLSEFALIKYRFHVEVMWLITLSKQKALNLPVLSDESKSILLSRVDSFSVDDANAIKKIERDINHDVKAVEYYLKNIMSEHETLRPLIEYVHFACTSEDINNVAYALICQKSLSDHLIPLISQIHQGLLNLAHTHANLPMLSRTHGQPASPTTFGKEMANIAYRLSRQLKQLSSFTMCAKFNGAVGNYNAHVFANSTVDWPSITGSFIQDLGLDHTPYSTQIEPHDTIAELCHHLIRVNTILIDFSRDMWRYISLGYLQLKVKDIEVGSSTMPHKVNPIDFENAEGNLGLANSLLTHLSLQLPVSRLQRDLTDSTQLRNIGSAFSHSTIAWNALIKGMSRISIDEISIKKDLDNHWEVLTEAIQITLRQHQVENAYEIIKKISRGKSLSKQDILNMIEQLPIPIDSKNKLKELTPASYIGLAGELAKKI